MKLAITTLGAVAALALGSAQAHAQDYLPEPAYAYAGVGQDQIGQADEGTVCDRDAFTIIGAHAGGTLLGFNAGVGGHFGFGDKCHGHHHRHYDYAPPAAPEAYGPPPPPPAYAQPGYEPRPGYDGEAYGPPPSYGPQVDGPPPGYGPPSGPPMYGQPCGCMDPRGW